MASLKLMALNERNKTLYIACMAFPTLFSTSIVLFNNSRKMTIKLANYHLYLIHYWDDQFACHSQF